MNFNYIIMADAFSNILSSFALQDGLVNFDKCRKQFELLVQLTLYQKSAANYCYSRHPGLDQWLTDIYTRSSIDRLVHGSIILGTFLWSLQVIFFQRLTTNFSNFTHRRFLSHTRQSFTLACMLNFSVGHGTTCDSHRRNYTYEYDTYSVVLN